MVEVNLRVCCVSQAISLTRKGFSHQARYAMGEALCVRAGGVLYACGSLRAGRRGAPAALSVAPERTSVCCVQLCSARVWVSCLPGIVSGWRSGWHMVTGRTVVRLTLPGYMPADLLSLVLRPACAQWCGRVLVDPATTSAYRMCVDTGEIVFVAGVCFACHIPLNPSFRRGHTKEPRGAETLLEALLMRVA